MTRYETRAWERFADRTVEVAIVDNKSGNTKARFETHDRVDGLEVGTLYLRVDDTIEDALRGGNGVGLYFIKGVVDDEDDEYDPHVEYSSFMGDSGFNEEMWRSTTDLLSTLQYSYNEGNLIPLQEVRGPSMSVMPKVYHEGVEA